jgi:hypothetical protein
MSQVTIYPHIKETVKGQDVPIADVYDWIKSTAWKEPVLAIMAEPDKKKREELKKELPYFTPAGTHTKRDATGLVQHSGKLCMDFDSIPNLPAAREQLCLDKYSECVFLSCSGKGLAVIVNIDPTRHLESFLFLEKYYKERYSLEVDKGCKDIPRARFVSYDPDLYTNSHATPVTLLTGTIDDDEGKYEWVLKLHEKKHQYVEGNRHLYLVALCFFCNKCGIDKEYTRGRILEREGDPYTAKELDKIVNDCYKNDSDFGTFQINKKLADLPPEISDQTREIFKYAVDKNRAGNKWTKDDVEHFAARFYMAPRIIEGIFENVYTKNQDEHGLDKKEEIERLAVFIRKNYRIRRNVILNKLEISYKDGAEANIDDIYIDSLKVKFKVSFEKIKALLESRFVEKYDPFLEYFESLPDWKDSDPDFIQELSTYVKTDNQTFWASQLKKALVRSIACSIDFTVNRMVMVLVGEKQSTGKTSFIRWLCPPELKKEYYTEAVMDSSKDSEFQLSDNFMWNLDELSSLSRHDIMKLKATISKDVVNLRRAYARVAERSRRRVNFWATTNDDGFLTEGQNTRWLCFNVLDINHNYNNWQSGEGLDINKIWSQAYALYHAGFNYHLDAGEFSQQTETNVTFQSGSIEKDIILSMYKICEKGEEGAQFLLNSELLLAMQSKVTAVVRLNSSNIGKAMKQIGFKDQNRKINRVSTRGWWVKPHNSMLGDNAIKYDDEPKPF